MRKGLLFGVGQQVRFHHSSFFERTIGHLAWAQAALRQGRDYTIKHSSRLLGDQFLTVEAEGGEVHGPLNAHLFKAA